MKQAARTRGQAIRTRIIGALVLASTLATAQAQEASPDGGYELGRGLRLGDSGFTLGGYATLEYRRERNAPEQLRSGHASAFVWWEGLERVKVFAEIDLLNAVSHQPRQSRYEQRRVSLERLYADYSFDEALTVRAGKFLTPIGRWNQIHAEPLVWTTSTPLITQAVFPRSVTGVSVSGRWHGAGQTVGYVVYAAGGSEWRADREQDPFARARGLRLTLPLGGDWQLGGSLAHYALNSLRAESRRLAALDLSWAQRGFEFDAEWVRTNVLSGQRGSWPDLPPWVGPGAGGGLAEGGAGSPPPGPMLPPAGAPRRTQGGFVQGVAPVWAEVFVVLRAEWLSDARWAGQTRRWVAGLTWRPNPATAFKVEWAEDDGSQPLRRPSLSSSLSVLF